MTTGGTGGVRAQPSGTLAASGPLADVFDVGLFDLDGVLYVGDEAVAFAADAVAESARRGLRRAFVTNNALRTPREVAAKLTALGIAAASEQVVTSAQAAARVLAGMLHTSGGVLIAGGAGLREAVSEAGLVPVDTAAGADAVVTGHDPLQTWSRLAEATLALRSGVPWVASNLDATIPDRRGRLPGAGAIVALLQTASGRAPDAVAGKPHPALHTESMVRTGAKHPLVIGDRLDTDIEGARAAGVPSLLVMTGVTEVADLLRAAPNRRPTFVARDLRGLLAHHPSVHIQTGQPRVTVRDAGATLVGTVIRVVGRGWEDRLRAATVLAWQLADRRGPAWTSCDGLDDAGPDDAALDHAGPDDAGLDDAGPDA